MLHIHLDNELHKAARTLHVQQTEQVLVFSTRDKDKYSISLVAAWLLTLTPSLYNGVPSAYQVTMLISFQLRTAYSPSFVDIDLDFNLLLFCNPPSSPSCFLSSS